MASENITQPKAWKLQHSITSYGDPILEGNDATFKLEDIGFSKLSEGQVLVKLIYLSNDPTERTWISPLGGSKKII
jgi:NADPH-dependent curcumin reductase CurA